MDKWLKENMDLSSGFYEIEAIINWGEGKYIFMNYYLKVKLLITQLCLILCDPVDWSLPGSFVHEISQARILEWVDIPFSRRSSQLRDGSQVSCLTGRLFTVWAAREGRVDII